MTSETATVVVGDEHPGSGSDVADVQSTPSGSGQTKDGSRGSSGDEGEAATAGQGDRTPDDWLQDAMKEDLSDWLGSLYGVDVSADEFFDHLETGVLLCRHANSVLQRLANRAKHSDRQCGTRWPSKTGASDGRTGLGKGTPGESHPLRRLLTYNAAARRGSFQARDNISQFIAWCRTSLGVPDTIIFETEDLVSRRNERNVLLCLLEVARRGARMYGMPAPTLVQFEQQIDAEIILQASLVDGEATTGGGGSSPRGAGTECRGVADGQKDGSLQPESTAVGELRQYGPVIEVDWMSLDEMVGATLAECTCLHQFPMARVAEGKYRIGDTQTLVFLRILRYHVMVRIGGGWDTLDSYLGRHDPCRSNSKGSANNAQPVQRQQQQTDVKVSSATSCINSDSTVETKVPANTEDNRKTPAVVKTGAKNRGESTRMTDAAAVKRSSSQKRPLAAHCSTPNLASAAVLPQSKGSAAAGRTRSSSRGEQRRSAPTSASSSAAARSVTSSADVARATFGSTARQRPVSPKSSTSKPVSSSLSTSRRLCRSTGNLTAMYGAAPASPLTTPRRYSARASPAVTPRGQQQQLRQQQQAPADVGKSVVISARGNRAPKPAGPATTPAPAAAPTTAGRNASMRSRSGIGPNQLLLPNCYQPGRVVSPRFAAAHCEVPITVSSSDSGTGAALGPPPSPTTKLRRTVSAQDRHSSKYSANPFDGYPDPPPEDKELNSRMEMLFEEYRKVERGLIFDGQPSSCPSGSAADGSSSERSPRPPPTSTSIKSVSPRCLGDRDGVVCSRRGQTFGSVRARSVGNLLAVPPGHSRPVHSASSSSSLSLSGTTSTASKRGTTTPPQLRGRASPRVDRRSQAPQPATPPPWSPKNAAVADREQAGRGAAAGVPTEACPTGAGNAGVGLPTSLHDVSRRLRDVKDAAVVNSLMASSHRHRPSATVPQSLSASGTPRAGSMPLDHVRTGPRDFSRTESGETAIASGNRASPRTPTARSNQSAITSSVDPASSGSNVMTGEVPRGRSRCSSRSLIPRPVSCSATLRRRNDREAPPSIDPALRRVDSGVDVTATGLSPTDEGLADGSSSSFEDAIQRMSATLHSCGSDASTGQAGRSSVETCHHVNRSSVCSFNAVDSNDAEYY